MRQTWTQMQPNALPAAFMGGNEIYLLQYCLLLCYVFCCHVITMSVVTECQNCVLSVTGFAIGRCQFSTCRMAGNFSQPA